MENFEQLLVRYQKQPPILQLTLQILAILVFFRHRDEKRLIAKILTITMEQPCSPDFVHKNIQQLKKEALLFEQGHQYYFCPKVLNHFLCLQLSRHPAFSKILIEIKSALRTFYYYTTSQLDVTQLFLSLYENNDEYVKKQIEKNGHAYWVALNLNAILIATPIATDLPWIEQRAPLLKELLKAHLLESNQETFLEPTLLSTKLSLLTYSLYQGNIENAENIAVSFPEKSYEQYAAKGILYFLHGNCVQAEKIFKQSMTHWRKITNNMKLSFQGIDGIFYLLCVAKLGVLQCKPNLGKILDPTSFEHIAHIWHPAYIALGMVIKLMTEPQINRDPFKDQLNELLSVAEHPFSFAIVALCSYWLIDDVDNMDEFISRVKKFYMDHQTQAPGIAAIVGDFMQIVQPHEYFQSAFSAVNFEKLYTKTPAWLASLSQLENTLAVNSGTKKTLNENMRVIWIVSVDISNQRLTIKPLEQKQRAKGIWSDGKEISIGRLHDSREKPAYFSEKDKQIAAILSLDHNWSYRLLGVSTLNKLLPILVNCQNLYSETHQEPLEIIRRDPALLVTEEDDGQYMIKLSPAYPDDGTERQFVVQQETPTRYVFFEFSPVLKNISKIIGKNGLKAPAKAKDFLLPLVEKASQRMEVQTHNIQDLAIPTEPGVTECHVQISPIDNGLKICFLVRPFGSEGPYFPPGKGNQQILMNIGQHPRHIKRALAEEIANANDIIESSSILQQQEPNDSYEFSLNDQESCLQVLSDLQAYQKKPIKMIWPQGQKYKVSVPLQSKNLSVHIKKEKHWFSLSGELQVTENEVVEMGQLLALMENQSGKFVEIRPGEFIALTEHFKKQLQDLKNISKKEADHFLVHPLGALALEPFLEELEDLETDNAWKQHVKTIEKSRGYQPIVPDTLQAELRPYQEEGFKWLARLAHWGVGACLADDMGLGKTVQTIALLLEQGKQGPCLIIAPTSVCHNWELEIARFAPTLKVQLLRQVEKKTGIDDLQALDVLICSYGMLPQSAHVLAEKHWQVIVLDEAQAIKNATTKRAQLVSTLHSTCRVALSGTPIENHLGELWSLFNFLNPGLFGTQKDFFSRFVSPIEKDKDWNAKRALKNLLQPFMLRRTKNMVLEELPDRIEKTIVIEMEPQEQAFYEALRQQALKKILDLRVQPTGQRRMCILAEITRLRRACGHPGLVDEAFNTMESAKLKMLGNLLDELIENHHKVLIFSQYIAMLSKIREMLEEKNIAYQYLDGSTPAIQRQKSVQDFQKGEGDAFLISLKAGGTGLNLTAANYVIHVDPWWNPAVEDQASDRAHRIGQKQPVTIYRLIMQNTIEEKILALHQDKRNLANELLDETQSSGKLTEEQLMGLMYS